MKLKPPPFIVVILGIFLSAYWLAPIAYSVFPSSIRSLGIFLLPGMTIGIFVELLGRKMLSVYMLPDERVGIIVAAISTVIMIIGSIHFSRSNWIKLLASCSVLTFMSLATVYFFKFYNG